MLVPRFLSEKKSMENFLAIFQRNFSLKIKEAKINQKMSTSTAASIVCVTWKIGKQYNISEILDA